ncbi:MAG: hypothetical protein V4633_06950 [Pseudomonadota bacterium]
MRNIPSNLTLACLLALAGGGAAAQRADPAMLRGHLQFLASDELEGRESGSRGYDVAAHYVATRFLQYGVLPGGRRAATCSRCCCARRSWRPARRGWN